MSTTAPDTTSRRSFLDDRVLDTASVGLAWATVATVTLIYGTAGVLVQDHVAEGLHGLGAILLHVTSGLLTVATGLLAMRGRLGWVVPVISGVLFAFSFLQASWGETDMLWLHVPGAFATTVASVGLAVWLTRR